jgi:hypothetical protein
VSLLSYLGCVIWRIQLLGSFIALNIFPIASALLVNGLLLMSAQGGELIQDLWSDKFIQDTDPPKEVTGSCL